MPHLLDEHLLLSHWLWLFGAFALGIAAGWLTYLAAAARWGLRPRHIAAGAATVGALLVVAKLLPARYGIRLELGVVLAVVGVIGCLAGWALRDLADFVPAPIGSAATAASGSYLFRDALAGMGAGPAYMRATTGRGGPAHVGVPSGASLARAPAPGGYTFPATLPFADATAPRRAEATTGPRRHWSWR